MIFDKYKLPSEDIANQCRELADICKICDKCEHTFFLDDEQSDLPNLYCAWLSDELIGFISTFITDSNSVEICCFVHPNHRRNHVATQLFDLMAKDYEDYYIQTPLRKDNTVGICFATYLGLDYYSTECKMELNIDDFKTDAINSSININSQINEDSFVYTASLDTNDIGCCEAFISGSTAVIHDVEIYEEYRGKKLSKPFLTLVLDTLFQSHESIILHVTKENIPAYKLYKSLNFKITDELAYYEVVL